MDRGSIHVHHHNSSPAIVGEVNGLRTGEEPTPATIGYLRHSEPYARSHACRWELHVNRDDLLVRRGVVTVSSVTPPLQQASKDQLVAFVNDEYPKVVAAVALITGDREGAEDSVQEALASLWQRDDGFRPDNVAAWVTVVAANRSRSTQRRHGAETRALERLHRRPETVVEDTAARLSDADLVAAAVDRLPDQQRRIVVLYYLGDHSVSDIAAALEVSEGTVKTHLSRARKTLSDALTQGADL